MLTVGIIKEYFFVAKICNKTIHGDLNFEDGFSIYFKITPAGILDVYYNDIHIWNELVEGETSFFGVESCDSISRIIACIRNKDDSWKEKYYFNESNIPVDKQ